MYQEIEEERKAHDEMQAQIAQKRLKYGRR